MLVLSECIKIFWGPNPISAKLPLLLQGSFTFGGIILIKYRLFVILVGIIIYIALLLLLKKTKIGLMIRAGVMDKEMVQALGINVKAIFSFVFLLGAGMVCNFSFYSSNYRWIRKRSRFSYCFFNCRISWCFYSVFYTRFITCN